MATTIRPEVSLKNPYWIEKHRYYELKHFCLQYPIWKKAYHSLDGLSARPYDIEIFTDKHHISNPTEKIALAKNYYRERIDMVKKATDETNKELSKYILIGVTEGISYDILKIKFNIPCCKDTYYKMYRKFFWILNKERG